MECSHCLFLGRHTFSLSTGRGPLLSLTSNKMMPTSLVTLKVRGGSEEIGLPRNENRTHQHIDNNQSTLYKHNTKLHDTRIAEPDKKQHK